MRNWGRSGFKPASASPGRWHQRWGALSLGSLGAIAFTVGLSPAPLTLAKPVPPAIPTAPLTAPVDLEIEPTEAELGTETIPDVAPESDTDVTAPPASEPEPETAANRGIEPGSLAVPGRATGRVIRNPQVDNPSAPRPGEPELPLLNFGQVLAVSPQVPVVIPPDWVAPPDVPLVPTGDRPEFSPPESVTPELYNLGAADMELAQIGQCRLTRRIERIYRNPSLAASRVVDIRGGTQVNLGGRVNDPEFGWIRVTSPVTGYIIATFLTPCLGSTLPPRPTPPTPPPVSQGNCGIAEINLAINATPNSGGFTIGGLSKGQGFRITGTSVIQDSPPSQSGRRWTPINRYGVTGWVSETEPGGRRGNVRRIACAAIGL